MLDNCIAPDPAAGQHAREAAARAAGCEIMVNSLELRFECHDPINENEDEDADEGSSNPQAGRSDPDQLIDRQALPVNFKLLR